MALDRNSALGGLSRIDLAVETGISVQNLKSLRRRKLFNPGALSLTELSRISGVPSSALESLKRRGYFGDNAKVHTWFRYSVLDLFYLCIVQDLCRGFGMSLPKSCAWVTRCSPAISKMLRKAVSAGSPASLCIASMTLNDGQEIVVAGDLPSVLEIPHRRSIQVNLSPIIADLKAKGFDVMGAIGDLV